MRIETATMSLLSLEKAFARAPREFLPAYDWLLEHEDAAPMARPLAKTGLADGLPVSLVAGMRGIHKPGGFGYALTVTSSGNELYSNGVMDQGDGTWILSYRAQQKNVGSQRSSKDIYNDALRRCMADGLPVGVFVREAGSTSLYRCKGLAFVESYYDGVFILHGPVRKDQPASFWSVVDEECGESGGVLAGEEGMGGVGFGGGSRGVQGVLPLGLDQVSDADERAFALVAQVRRRWQDRFREGLLRAYGQRCAITSYDVVPALQAAHISSYLGPKSQTTSNGLLLRADLHLLYDAYLISVDPDDLKVRIAPQIACSQYREIDGARLRLPDLDDDRPSQKRLATHFESFRLRQRTKVGESVG